MELRRLARPRNAVMGMVAGLFGIFLAGALAGRDYELLHTASVRGLPCAAKLSGKSCGAWLHLTIGNTGRKEQEEVQVTWPFDAARWNLGESASDLVASARPSRMPAFEQRVVNGATVHLIRNFAPNQVVEFKGVCAKCDDGDIRALVAAGVRVEGRGTVEKGDPRASTFMRGMRNAFSIVTLRGG